MLDFVSKIWKTDVNYLSIAEFSVADFLVIVWIVVNMDIFKRLIVSWCIHMEYFYKFNNSEMYPFICMLKVFT